MTAARTPMSGGLAGRLAILAVVLLAVTWMLPLAWVFAASFKPNAVLMVRTDGLLAPPFTLANYGNLIGTSSLVRWLTNSAIVALGQTAGVLILSSLAGYGFARTRFPGKQWVFGFVLAGLAVPEHAILIPLHRLIAGLELHNTYTALILPRLAIPFGVYLMTQYFKAIPRDLEEAALLDNASRLKIFLRIVLPMSLPAQATLGIFSFLTAWNDYVWPLVSATRPDMYTLTVGLGSIQTNFAQAEGIGFLMAQAVFAGLPIFIVYLFFQKHIVAAVSGTTAG